MGAGPAAPNAAACARVVTGIDLDWRRAPAWWRAGGGARAAVAGRARACAPRDLDLVWVQYAHHTVILCPALYVCAREMDLLCPA